MCPSYRVTRNERDVTRGRANTLRLAISGQLGEGALTVGRHGSDYEALRQLQGLPAGMPDRGRHGADENRTPSGARCDAWIFAPRSSRWLFASLRALRRQTRLAREVSVIESPRPLLDAGEKLTGFSASRPACLVGRRRRFKRWKRARGSGPDVALFADCFNRYFEPHQSPPKLSRFSTAAGYRLHCPKPPAGGGRPALLRPHLSLGRHGRGGEGGSQADARNAPFAARSRQHADRRSWSQVAFSHYVMNFWPCCPARMRR